MSKKISKKAIKKSQKKKEDDIINEDALFPTPEGIPILPVGNEYLCLGCKFYDNLPLEKMVRTKTLEAMFSHQLEHKVKAESSKTPLKEMTPYSKFLLHLKNSEAPMIFRFLDENGIEEKAFLPLLPLPKPTTENKSFLSMNTDLEGQRVRINLMVETIDTSQEKFYSLSDMISQECMECPHCYEGADRNIKNKSPLEMRGIKPAQLSIYLFKCDLNICPGIKNSYSGQNHLIEWTDQLIDLCLDKPEKEVELMGK